MKKKIILSRILKVTLLLAAVIVSTLALQRVLQSSSRANYVRVNGFYLEKKNTVDVVFIGASEVYCDFAPGYAYGRYGFTSYPFVTQGSTARNFTTAIKEAVRTQHPKLIVIEINGALYDEAHYDKEAYARYFIDSVPFNGNKISYIQDNIAENKLEYYLPIIKYHGNWKQIPLGLHWNVSALGDDLRGYSLLKGVKTKTDTVKIERSSLYNLRPGVEEDRCELLEEARADLAGVLEYCKQENIRVLFVRFPHAVTEEEAVRFGRAATAGDLIREYGFDYVSFDFLFDDIGLDSETDFYNPEHLNIYGQKKFTDYFSRFLMENYGIGKSKLDKKTAARWDKCAAYYDRFALLSETLMEHGVSIYLGDDILTYAAVKNMKKYEKYLH